MEQTKIDVAQVEDSIRGCLIAGAAGDALGYPVEFQRVSSIISRYGGKGITKFDLSSDGKALISDDTQMTLFTANGLMVGLVRNHTRGVEKKSLEEYVRYAYLDWYHTQSGKYQKAEHPHTWLCNLPELSSLRAPGITCLNACKAMLQGSEVENNSKGCGGIMRVAPLALLCAGYESHGNPLYTTQRMDEGGAKIAALTHKHPLGFLPAAMLTHLLYRLVLLDTDSACQRIEEIAYETIDMLDKIYQGQYEKHKQYLADLTHKAILLSKNDESDGANILQLGEGWVGEETWAIALYCALRHIDSVEDAIIAAVNHDGDSDSTGAVCGNIMGAIYGYEHLRQHRIFCPEGKELEQTLELSNITLSLADDLYAGFTAIAPIRRLLMRYVEMQPAE